MRSLLIVHARPFAQPRLGLRAIIDNLRQWQYIYGHGKNRMKNGVVFFGG